jgi:hypothetical protein
MFSSVSTFDTYVGQNCRNRVLREHGCQAPLPSGTQLSASLFMECTGTVLNSAASWLSSLLKT